MQSITRKTGWGCLTLLCIMLVPITTYADSSEKQVLERKLQERNRVILELLERVESLERRVGVKPRDRGPFRTDANPSRITDEWSPETRTTTPPGQVVVDEDSAERALERSLTQDGAVLLRPGIYEIEPGITYTRQEDSTPSLVSSGGRFFTGELERNGNNLSADLAFRLGLPWDSQLELGIPYRWREVESVTRIGFAPTSTFSNSGAGVGDLRIGWAKTLLREKGWRPDLVGRLTWDTASGDISDNNVSLGGGFHELYGSLTTIKRQDPLAFVGGVSYGYTFEKNQIQPAPILSANFGSYVALSPETSLKFLLSAAYQGETELAGQSIEGSDRTLGSLVIGGSTLLAPGTLMNLSVSIGLTDDADDFSISLSVPIRSGY